MDILKKRAKYLKKKKIKATKEANKAIKRYEKKIYKEMIEYILNGQEVTYRYANVYKEERIALENVINKLNKKLEGKLIITYDGYKVRIVESRNDE